MTALLTLVAVLAAVLLSGRALMSVLGLRSLRRFTPLNAAFSAVFGLATVTLLFAWLTAAGLRAPTIALLLLLLHALAVGFRRDALARPRGPLLHWLALMGAVTGAALLALLPVLRSGSYAVDNDTHTYCAFSEWLQVYGFGTPCPWDPESPITYFPNLWQQLRTTLGASYPLALAQAAMGASSSLLVYPAVSAAGLALGAGAVAALARCTLRLPPSACFLAAGLYGLLPGPAQWAHHNGFLQQTLALPVLLVGVAVLARPAALFREGPRGLVLVVLLAAFLLLVYLPFVPLLAAAALPAAWRAIRKTRRAWLGLATTAILTWGFSLGAPLRAGGQLTSMTQAVPGSHVAFTPREFGEFALGTHVAAAEWRAGPGQATRRFLARVAPGLLLLALLGLPRLRTPLPSAAVVLALLLGATAYYSLVAKDPWTGQTGHTWSLFKLFQWSYPFVVALQAAGLVWLARRLHARPLIPAAAFLALGLLPVHWGWSDDLGSSLRRLFPAARPLDALAPLQRSLRELPGGPLLVLNRPADNDWWLGIYVALVAWPRAIVADWEGSVDVRAEPGAAPFRERLRQLGDAEGPVPILLGLPPWDRAGLLDLGPGVARAIDLRPRVVKVRNPDDLRGEDDRPPFTLGSGRTKVSIFTAREQEAELLLDLQGEPPAEIAVAIVPPRFAGEPLRAGLKAVPETRVSTAPGFRLPLRLETGLTRITLRAEGGGERTVIQDAHILVR